MSSILSKECLFKISQWLLEYAASSPLSSFESHLTSRIATSPLLTLAWNQENWLKKKSWFLTAEILELFKIIESRFYQEWRASKSWF